MLTISTRLFRTSIFQIALLYLLLFSVTAGGLLMFIYWSTSGLIDRQMAETVQAEIRGLAEQYRAEGVGRLIEVIRERSGPRGDPQNVYLLVDTSLQPLAGNLQHWPDALPGEDGWVEMRLKRGDHPDVPAHVIRARVFELPDGWHLLVGRDTEERGDFRQIMLNSLAWAALPAVALGLLGGILLGRYALHRVDAVRETSQQIMRGDLSRRMPVSGSGDEFDRLASTINEMLDQIDKLMGGMRAVTDSLAHDLRSPLTRAKGGIEMALRRTGDAESSREALEQTNAELDTILRTFEALINIARAEAGMNRLALAPLDISVLAGDLAELYEPIAEDSGLTLDSAIASGLVVAGHRELLGQALANLLENAIKYTPSGGHIRVSLSRAGDRILLVVADTGPGIPPEDYEHVQQRFVRLDASRGTPGSGLGLSLVAAVARLHDATLELANNAPGLKVTIDLPPG